MRSIELVLVFALGNLPTSSYLVFVEAEDDLRKMDASLLRDSFVLGFVGVTLGWCSSHLLVLGLENSGKPY